MIVALPYLGHPCRLLAHTLADLLRKQLLLDVGGSGGVFTVGPTSRLVGATLAAAVRLKDTLGCRCSTEWTLPPP